MGAASLHAPKQTFQAAAVQTQRVPTIINTGHEPVLPGAAASTWSRRPAIALSITEDSLLLPQGHHLQGYSTSLHRLPVIMATEMLEHQPVQAVGVSRAPLFQRRRADTQAQDQNLDSTPENPTPLTKSGVAPITNADLVCPFFL